MGVNSRSEGFPLRELETSVKRIWRENGLSPSTVDTYLWWVKHYYEDSVTRERDPDMPVFVNAHRECLSRDGVAYILNKHAASAAREVRPLRRQRITPHVLSHSCAVALLQAGVDVSVIRDYLGHASVTTTSRYITANLQMKRDALEAFWKRAGIETSSPTTAWKPTPDLLAFYG